MKPRIVGGLILGLWLRLGLGPAEAAEATRDSLWAAARAQAGTHRFSTLFTAQEVRRYLSEEQGLRAAVEWCKQTAVTKVYLETFRGNYQAEREPLERSKAAFRSAGIEVSGCVTTTRVGKASTGWKEVACCYTDKPTQEKLQAIFEYAAGLFDEIMIDDFWFTDCACDECDAARKSRTVTVGDRSTSVQEDSWAAYRCELMGRLSEERILAPARKANPKVQLIIKYPQWYDRFHVRGYDVVRETREFDRIWVGTETRDYGDSRWGGTPQYEAWFIMRWLGGIGGAKCGGGWFDPYGTTEATYVEQARQTVLGGARESVLFAYGSLLRDTGPRNIEVLRTNIPELLAVAKEVRSRQIAGLAAYKPPGSDPGAEPRVFDFAGMLGLPLAPCHAFPTNAPALFVSMHALKDANLVSRLGAFIRSGKPVLMTDGLAAALSNRVEVAGGNVHILPVKGEPKTLLETPQQTLDALRAALLKPFRVTFLAPGRVALYLFQDGSWVIENFNDQAVETELNGQKWALAPRAWRYAWK